MAGGNYSAADSPKHGEAERYAKLVADTSAAVGAFHQTTRALGQKLQVLGTPADTRANHRELKELADKGNALVASVNRRLQQLYALCAGPPARTRKTQVNKLSGDFKREVQAFEDACRRLVDAEKAAIAHIRKSSHSYRRERDSLDDNGAGAGLELGGYNEDQLYAQANVTTREQDLIHINHQVREVNAAFREVDELVTKQGEVVVEIDDNTAQARENVENALDNVRQADNKKRYCACSKTKLICCGLFALVVAVLVLTLVLSLKP
ncbi:hypothetical protein PybrP1_011659 [[Pythium] brassicae (nom. inval.)]|nr:hypothetical protein PybrP1_011659 [[Pythium] brassicae (nom. inval.)]